jgi:cytochrome c oxidase subunit 2
MKRANAVLASTACLLFATGCFADQPAPWQMDFQPAASPIMSQVRWFEHYTLWFIVPITLFVLALLITVMVKFRASKNPVPSRTSHNTLIEVAWTIGPVLVLLFLAVPSFDLLTAQLTFPQKPDVTIKVTGTQSRIAPPPASPTRQSIRGSWPSTMSWSFRSTRRCASS